MLFWTPEIQVKKDSLSDTVWDLHVLSGDEMRKILKTVDELELPAELRAEAEEEGKKF